MFKMTQQGLLDAYNEVRHKTLQLCEPLEIEDYVIQGMEDVSPPKWHLAHTTWFFETFILVTEIPNYSVFDPIFPYLFNSYYQQIGQPYPRVKRGVLSRPTVKTIYAYRKCIDDHINHYLATVTDEVFEKIAPVIVLGIQHEQQHQELLLMDIKYNFFLHPHNTVYHSTPVALAEQLGVQMQAKMALLSLKGGVINVGAHGENFSFDNELPQHQHFLKPYKIANRMVTNGDYLAFIEQGGYKNPSYWLSDGWEEVQKNHWQAPLYWYQENGKWYIYTLQGQQALNLSEPVVHVSFYEAEAYARFCEMRLPTEMEWEHAARNHELNPTEGHFLESEKYHPQSLSHVASDIPWQMFGDAWEWTASPYVPYPGYQPLTGALGEYNGKFMSNQMVLRGGSCVTPKHHIRTSYRNFYQPNKRWQFSGIRLATD